MVKLQADVHSQRAALAAAEQNIANSAAGALPPCIDVGNHVGRLLPLRPDHLETVCVCSR